VHRFDPKVESSAVASSLEKRMHYRQRLQRFAAKPIYEKYASLVQRIHRAFPNLPLPCRLSFGSWYLMGSSAIDSDLLWRNFEPTEIRFVEKFLEPGMVVLDIGAHHGLYTLLASRRIGSAGKVIAFEPSPRERRLLGRNLRLNGSSNVRVESYALGSSQSKADLFLVEGGEDGCNSLRPPVVSGTTKTVSVNVISLDDYLLKSGIESIDFVKLDVEGGELEVLRGATNLINGRARPVFFVEVQDIRTRPWGYPAYEIVQLLDRAGYDWFHIHDNGKLAQAAVQVLDYDANLVAIPRNRVQIVLDRLVK
jgi:FkbM family methyltransferase